MFLCDLKYWIRVLPHMSVIVAWSYSKTVFLRMWLRHKNWVEGRGSTPLQTSSTTALSMMTQATFRFPQHIQSSWTCQLQLRDLLKYWCHMGWHLIWTSVGKLREILDGRYWVVARYFLNKRTAQKQEDPTSCSVSGVWGLEDDEFIQTISRSPCISVFYVLWQNITSDLAQASCFWQINSCPDTHLYNCSHPMSVCPCHGQTLLWSKQVRLSLLIMDVELYAW